MEYMAGGDHLPVKPLPSRHDIGPRPPVPPMPTANFFTLGRMMMQLAFSSTLRGTSLLASMACRTVEAFLMISSSAAGAVGPPRDPPGRGLVGGGLAGGGLLGS